MSADILFSAAYDMLKTRMLQSEASTLLKGAADQALMA
jgi:hypothetical protein